MFEVRSSFIQGLGAFAVRQIRRGTRIIEYRGERITHDEADRRYADKVDLHPHVLLFTVDKKIVIDGGVDGNDARFINHSCNPNCEAVNESGRVYIEALRTIPPGEELTYDYQLEREQDDESDWEAQYVCRCGADACRGTMLEPAPKPRKKLKRGT